VNVKVLSTMWRTKGLYPANIPTLQENVRRTIDQIRVMSIPSCDGPGFGADGEVLVVVVALAR